MEKPGRPCLGRRGRPQTMRGGVREGVRSSGVERSAHDLTERRRSRSALSTAVMRVQQRESWRALLACGPSRVITFEAVYSE